MMNGVITRQTTSFTRKADRMPLVNTTAARSCCGLRRSTVRSATHSKKPPRCRCATITVIEKSSTMVGKSIARSACCAVMISKCHHQDCPDDGGARPVDLQPREFPQGEDEIAAEENGPRSDAAGIGEYRRVQLQAAPGLRQPTPRACRRRRVCGCPWCTMPCQPRAVAVATLSGRSSMN